MDNFFEEIIKKVVSQCFKEENLENSKLNISITLTTPENIKKINKEYRNVDRPTDVLSFPIFSREEIDNFCNLDEEKKVKEMELGDIIICIDILQEHAQEYNTGILREMLYMITHGVCHLLGYDHEIKEEKEQMRELEEKILEKIGVGRIDG